MLNKEDFIKSIKYGSVFYFKYEEVHETIPHYFVILNKDSTISSVLVIPVSTTQLTKRKAYYERHGLSLDTLIEVTAQESKWILKKDSVFDCSSTKIIEPLEFYDLYQSKNLKYIWIMPENITIQLKNAVLTSIHIEPWIKEFI